MAPGLSTRAWGCWGVSRACHLEAPPAVLPGSGGEAWADGLSPAATVCHPSTPMPSGAVTQSFPVVMGLCP